MPPANLPRRSVAERAPGDSDQENQPGDAPRRVLEHQSGFAGERVDQDFLNSRRHREDEEDHGRDRHEPGGGQSLAGLLAIVQQRDDHPHDT